MSTTKKKPKKTTTDQARLEAVRKWRKDNPRPTFEHEAFGATWDVPEVVSFDLILWTGELAEEGRGIDELSGPEVGRFVRGVLGDDLLSLWAELEIPAEAIAIEAGAVFVEQNRLGAERAASRSASPDED